MIKPFNELVKLDLTTHAQKKPTFYKKDGQLFPTSEDKWLDYIEWAKVLELLYENGAESVWFKSSIHPEKTNTLCIYLSIDGKETTIDYPIIDGNAVIQNPNQMQLHKAELRGFVKAVAIHTGLGLNLWIKEERQLQEYVNKKEPKEKPQKQALSVAQFNKLIGMIRTGEPHEKHGVLTIEKSKSLWNLNEEQLLTLNDLQNEA